MSSTETAGMELEENEIAALTTPKVWERGRELFESSALSQTTRREREITALCIGSGAEYEVGARFGKSGVSETECSCPYEHGGVCKHVVALLLAWHHAPESFENESEAATTSGGKSPDRAIAALLKGREREELAQIIVQLVQTEPKLRAVLTRLTKKNLSAGEITKTRTAVAALVKRIERAGEAYRTITVKKDLQFHLRAAQSLASRPDDAARLYAAILEGLMAHGGDAFNWEEMGNLASASEVCATGLQKLMPLLTPAQQTPIFLVLARAVVFRLNSHSDFAPDASAILETCPDSDWAAVEAILNSALKSTSSWRNARVYHFSGEGEISGYEDLDSSRVSIIELKARRARAQGDENSARALILEHGTPWQRIETHLHSGEFDEATHIASAQLALPTRLRFADALLAAGQWERARDWARRSHLVAWLALASAERGESDALELNMQVFRARPSLEMWARLKTLAPAEQWPALREQLLDELSAPAQRGLRFDIFLWENAFDEALALWPQLSNFDHAQRFEHFAGRAEKTRPELAAQIWNELVDYSIAERSRDFYRLAARALVRVKKLWDAGEKSAEWTERIATIRAQNSRLPALLEELTKAKL